MDASSPLDRMVSWEWNQQAAAELEALIDQINLVAAHYRHLIDLERADIADEEKVARYQVIVDRAAADRRSLQARDERRIAQAADYYDRLHKEMR